MSDQKSDLYTNEVDEMFRNAYLTNELERYRDESLDIIDYKTWPVQEANEFLESLLDWEKSPVLPVSKWFEPELVLPNPDTLNLEQLHVCLLDIIEKLYKQKFVLVHTDHLSDLELYKTIFYKILPSEEKKLNRQKHYISWDCSALYNEEKTEFIWLTYYADENERLEWQETHNGTLPEKKKKPFQRNLPIDPETRKSRFSN